MPKEQQGVAFDLRWRWGTTGIGDPLIQERNTIIACPLELLIWGTSRFSMSMWMITMSRWGGMSCLHWGCFTVFIGFSLNKCFSSDIVYQSPSFFVTTAKARFPQRLPCSPTSPISKNWAATYVGDGTNFGALSCLRLIHLHSNRLLSSIPPMDFKSLSS